ncbi:hypothetical protein BC835DRAFT_1379655 [Cytidiella melzeri]|nr:hypothetical protein BC835DRAFT_1379655 [Cytidiella melzeri]
MAILGFVVIVAMSVRLFRLSRLTSVVFNEVHFGKYASKYIKSQYFVDVHPSLAKLLIRRQALYSDTLVNTNTRKVNKNTMKTSRMVTCG